ncbi:MAG: 23S rRNA (uracil(1939)-C(5))-methyltransferase RlmD [Cyanobacteria bacterium K_DeepCast_35m_m2_023]|nr:23S rRNA (uracil(1939)-C(5))-methyltransferase RlmD [Cyanobacteria bacterium K_DeepCast_35m_m2_023]
MGSIVELLITGLSHDGAGVGRLEDGRVVFVATLLPGERARVQLTTKARRHWIGVVVERLNDSPERRTPPCILSDHCGGCSLQHLAYPGQLTIKHNQVREALERIGHLSARVDPVLASGLEQGYRNRAVIPLERTADGRLRAGYYRRGSHRIVNMNRCPVLDPRLDALIAPLKADLDHSDWPVDRHLEHGGGLRHLALRLGHSSGEVLITLISSHADLPEREALASHWLERWPQVVGVMLNQQPHPGNTLFGPTSDLLAGRPWLQERFCGLSYQLGCDTFFQVNTPQAERVVPLLLEALGSQPRGVVDAYCGVGAFSLPLAAAGHRVIGLEMHPASVALAQQNASRNKLSDRAQFEQGPVAEHLSTHLDAGAELVLVDPPRKGLEASVCRALCERPSRQLAYLSCDPATLARDLQQLVGDGGYQLERVLPLDFFPNTSHVESLALLRVSS